MTAAPAPGSERDNPGVRIPPPFFFVVPLLAGLWLERLMPVGLVPASWDPTLTIVGASMVVAALLFGAWAILTCVRARTHVIPVRPATTLVTSRPTERAPAYWRARVRPTIPSPGTLAPRPVWQAERTTRSAFSLS